MSFKMCEIFEFDHQHINTEIFALSDLRFSPIKKGKNHNMKKIRQRQIPFLCQRTGDGNLTTAL